MSGTSADGTDASRTRAILTPSSDGIDDGKRRPDAGAMEELLRPSVAVKPHPPQLHVQPRLLLPLMLLPREHLPLASIEFGASDRDMPPSRLFESRVKMLDLESRFGASTSVLVARNETRGTVHVLERQGSDEGLYVMCQLGSWVDLAALAARATAVAWERLRALTSQHRPGGEGNAPLAAPPLFKESGRKRAAVEAVQSLVRKRVRSRSVTTVNDAGRHVLASVTGNQARLRTPDRTTKPEREEAEIMLADIAPALDLDGMASTAQPPATAEAIFDGIRLQYSEALYKSMGSLAYFVKGPLSRARSAFHIDLDTSLDMSDLIDFLKSLILTTVQIDTKYRDTIPDLIAKVNNFDGLDENSSKRKRRPRKMKIGKSGLYPHEDESIRKWWASKQQPGDDQSSSSMATAQLKSHVSLLRTRETQLQMIIALEILALEPLKAGEDVLPRLPEAESNGEPTTPVPAPRKRSRLNLQLLIDVHADRLTIWQSIASDEQLLLGESQVSRQPDGQLQPRTSAEPLRDFCVDIIVPFFSSRLPEICDGINRKLGGPLLLSPPKPKPSRTAPKKREQKPGTAAKRPTPVRSQRTLQRALSAEQQHRRSLSRGPSNAIALLRSATTASLVNVKREGSEPTSARNLKEAPRLAPAWKRPPLSHSASAPHLVAGSKESRKALVEAELKDAISALRKPNRDVVGKAMAEADERRLLSAKKAKKPPSRAPVVVKATPATTRFTDVLAPNRHSTGDHAPPFGVQHSPVLPSSDGKRIIPSTGQRPSHRDAFSIVGASSPPAADFVVDDTPMKPPARPCFIRRFVGEALAVPAPPSSPLAGAGRGELSVLDTPVRDSGGGVLGVDLSSAWVGGR
ncbi:DNA replication regulator Sld3 [Ophiocordyceps camponoti-floridani]|uniref:DNA replication regulator Sld3 n=1 Tax=Ophiocordyceps camponoti-floridani TaxID=2030778 RepID=A0A8H4Q0Q4_9HYPO|nr:DNA replication regulator Sld3 [Ophiocordyceps camponoti-floridani]